MLQNAYLIATIGFDTAENEPSKLSESLANFANCECAYGQRNSPGWPQEEVDLRDVRQRRDLAVIPPEALRLRKLAGRARHRPHV